MALKILVAEDDRHTRRILDHIFTKDPAFRDQDVELFLAPDGEEALKLFEKETPDLVISDLLMPRLDGFALCRAIRRLPAGKDVPVIVTSAIYKETALLNRMRVFTPDCPRFGSADFRHTTRSALHATREFHELAAALVSRRASLLLKVRKSG